MNQGELSAFTDEQLEQQILDIDAFDPFRYPRKQDMIKTIRDELDARVVARKSTP